jgi:thiamine biosynthesis protein ThiS
MKVTINGQEREFADLQADARLSDLIALLELKGDRVAVEHNGEIVSRPEWATSPVKDGDKMEIVHFVGGGRG